MSIKQNIGLMTAFAKLFNLCQGKSKKGYWVKKDLDFLFFSLTKEFEF